MNREIKFRGLRTDGKGWVYGGCVQGVSGKCYIFQGYDQEHVEGDCQEVIPYSIGQFTGLLDKNGTEIYEGDVLYFKTYEGGGFGKVGIDCNSVVCYGKHTLGGDYTLHTTHGFYLSIGSSSISIYYWINTHKAVVIGNIHEEGGSNG